jgi:hypothetical protein
MTDAHTHLGDSHNFGRRVEVRGARIVKPRTLLWEWLVLSADSPLRRLLDEAAGRDGLGADAFGFLPALSFFPSQAEGGGEVERIDLAPLPAPSSEGRRALAILVGRSLALWSWLGVTDLHWENLVLGVDGRGRTVLAPLDVEMILADMSMPTETKLLPDADPEYAAICRHACGVRRVLPYLGKPVLAADLVAMAGAYLGTLALLDRHAKEIAAVLADLPALGETPIRVCLRGTGDYVRARSGSSRPLWPPLLEAEEEQLSRGDIPYFFRLYGKPGIHYYGDASLREIRTLPLEGDVPQLDPLLQVSRGLRAPSRKKLREEGLFTVLGAFDHPSITGSHESDGLGVTFRGRTLVVKLPDGEELEARRDMSAFVGSVYLPCRCGEVLSVFVPAVTACEAAPRERPRAKKRATS